MTHLLDYVAQVVFIYTGSKSESVYFPFSFAELFSFVKQEKKNFNIGSFMMSSSDHRMFVNF